MGGGGGRGGQGGCERRIEVFVKIQKKIWGEGGGGVGRWVRVGEGEVKFFGERGRVGGGGGWVGLGGSGWM